MLGLVVVIEPVVALESSVPWFTTDLTDKFLSMALRVCLMLRETSTSARIASSSSVGTSNSASVVPIVGWG